MTKQTTSNQLLNIAVAGGKGGVGKTSVALALVHALQANNIVPQLLDCDVENPNCHLLLPVQSLSTSKVKISVPVVDKDKCTHCGDCVEFCQFNALADIKTDLMVFKELCHSCGGCIRLCPAQAMTLEDHETGYLFKGTAPPLPFVYGQLKIGSPQTISVIDAVLDELDPTRLNVIDAAPGTGCASVAGTRQADVVILVTEPSPFGLHDLDLSVSLVREMKKPFGVIVNRMEEGKNSIRDYCKEQNIPLLMEIPFSREIAKACASGQGILDVYPSLTDSFYGVFQVVSEMVS